MRTLEFQIAGQEQVTDCHTAQAYVVGLLFRHLNQQGFDLTLPAYAKQTFLVGIRDKHLPIEVNCQALAEGGIHCAVTPQPNEEELDWFDRIEAQSMIKQLAQAVENILNEQPYISALTWKNGN